MKKSFHRVFALDKRERKKEYISYFRHQQFCCKKLYVQDFSIFFFYCNKYYHHQTLLKVFPVIKKKKRTKFFFSMNRTFVVITQLFFFPIEITNYHWQIETKRRSSLVFFTFEFFIYSLHTPTVTQIFCKNHGQQSR